MPASPADSAIYRDLFADDETARLFSDSAEIRAMLLVEGALAKVQGEAGMIPLEAALFIERSAREVLIDPAGLARETARNGVPVPAFIAAFRKAAEAPEMMQYVHWGATSQDIMDTAQALRLKRMLALWSDRLDDLLTHLADLAKAHADLPMTGRTYGQAATPTTFGALVASWGREVLAWRSKLAAVQGEVGRVSLSGAAGTLSAMGDQGAEIRAGLAKALGLTDPGHSWHAERSGVIGLAQWMAGLTASLGKMGNDLILLSQTGIAEVAIAGAGGSSTMPQKQNPVGPSVLVAIARQVAALAQVITGAGVHSLQRDGAAWFTEWMSLPQICILSGRALALAGSLAQRLTPDAKAMQAGLDADGGLIQAEALTFALAQIMPRPDAAEAVKALSARVRSGEGGLLDLARVLWPGLDLSAGLGTAPAEARAFAASVRR